MKTIRNKNNTNPNPGWDLRDQSHLDRYDNAQADPAIQMFTEDELEEEPELRT